MRLVHVGDDLGDLLLLHGVQQVFVGVLEFFGQYLVLDQASDGGAVAQGGGLDGFSICEGNEFFVVVEAVPLAVALDESDDPLHALGTFGHVGAVVQPNGDGFVDVQLVGVVGEHGFFGAGEDLVSRLLAFAQLSDHGEVVVAENDVLHGSDDGSAVGRREQVMRGEHEDACLGLGVGGERYMHGHLVAVEVGVEGVADEGVYLDGLAVHEDGLERLDAESVQSGCAVEQHGMLANDVFERVPHFGSHLVDHALGGLDIARIAALHQRLHDEGLEELQRHLLGQPALVQLEVRPNDDNRAARVVDAFAEEVLSEAALLALEHVGEGLERAVVGADHGSGAPSVVDEGVHGFLKQPFLVVDDALRRSDFGDLLQPVVAVDDAPIQVI